MILFGTQFMAALAMPLLAATEDIVLYILPVAGCMLLSYGIYQVIAESGSSQDKKIGDRLRGKHKQEEAKTAANILRRGAMGQASSFADNLVGQFKLVPKLQTLLDQSGVNWSAAQTLLNLGGVSVLATVGLFFMQVNPIVAIGCGITVFMLPLLWLSMKRARRLNKITEQLPDVFDMMSQALKAGHSLAGAIQLVYEQGSPPIATEFAQVYHEQNLGIKIEDALQSMADRVDSLDVRFFVTAVCIQRQTGGDLSEVLENIGSVIRERIELAGLVRGLTAEGRLSGWVLFFLPILVFFASWHLNPEYASILFTDPRGQLMLITAGGMQLVGLAMIRWIVNIKV